MKLILITMLVFSLTFISSQSFAFADGDVVTCTYSNGHTWTTSADQYWSVGDLTDYCLDGGGAAVVTRPSIAGAG